MSAALSDYVLIPVPQSDKRPSSLIRNSGTLSAPCFIAFSNTDLINQFGFLNQCFAVGMCNFVDFGSCSYLEISQTHGTISVIKKPYCHFLVTVFRYLCFKYPKTNDRKSKDLKAILEVVNLTFLKYELHSNGDKLHACRPCQE